VEIGFFFTFSTCERGSKRRTCVAVGKGHRGDDCGYCGNFNLFCCSLRTIPCHGTDNQGTIDAFWTGRTRNGQRFIRRSMDEENKKRVMWVGLRRNFNFNCLVKRD